jgi:hypothetical protein
LCSFAWRLFQRIDGKPIKFIVAISGLSEKYWLLKVNQDVGINSLPPPVCPEKI